MISSISTEEAAKANTQANTNDQGEVDPTMPEGETFAEPPEQEDLSQGNILDSPENIQVLKAMNFDTKQTFSKEELKMLMEKIFIRKGFSPDELGFFQNMIDKMIKEVPEMREIPREEFVSYFDMKVLMSYIEQNKPVEDSDSEREDFTMSQEEATGEKTEM